MIEWNKYTSIVFWRHFPSCPNVTKYVNSFKDEERNKS